MLHKLSQKTDFIRIFPPDLESCILYIKNAIGVTGLCLMLFNCLQTNTTSYKMTIFVLSSVVKLKESVGGGGGGEGAQQRKTLPFFFFYFKFSISYNCVILLSSFLFQMLLFFKTDASDDKGIKTSHSGEAEENHPRI